jgi:hypothetical protein
LEQAREHVTLLDLPAAQQDPADPGPDPMPHVKIGGSPNVLLSLA